MDNGTLDKLRLFLEANKGKRKFVQTVELAVNFSGVDFSKQANRLNVEAPLRHAFGAAAKIIVFADDKGVVDKASSAGAAVVPSSEIQRIATEKAKLSELLGATLLAQPSLMPQIAKQLGQFLGPRNKMPKPLIGDVDIAAIARAATSTVSIRSKGKFLPTVHCSVGNESMGAEQIADNIESVLNSIAAKAGRHNIKSVYVKLTMSEPLRIV